MKELKKENLTCGDETCDCGCREGNPCDCAEVTNECECAPCECNDCGCGTK
jgi:hypothetical protein